MRGGAWHVVRTWRRGAVVSVDASALVSVATAMRQVRTRDREVARTLSFPYSGYVRTCDWPCIAMSCDLSGRCVFSYLVLFFPPSSVPSSLPPFLFSSLFFFLFLSKYVLLRIMRNKTKQVI